MIENSINWYSHAQVHIPYWGSKRWSIATTRHQNYTRRDGSKTFYDGEGSKTSSAGLGLKCECAARVDEAAAIAWQQPPLATHHHQPTTIITVWGLAICSTVVVVVSVTHLTLVVALTTNATQLLTNRHLIEYKNITPIPYYMFKMLSQELNTWWMKFKIAFKKVQMYWLLLPMHKCTMFINVSIHIILI